MGDQEIGTIPGTWVDEPSSLDHSDHSTTTPRPRSKSLVQRCLGLLTPDTSPEKLKVPAESNFTELPSLEACEPFMQPDPVIEEVYYEAAKDPFYKDLIQGFVNMVLAVYRSNHVPKLNSMERPGMFILKKAPKGRIIESLASTTKPSEKFSAWVASQGVMKIDTDNTARPVLTFKNDFFISPCSSDKGQASKAITHKGHGCVDIERLAIEFMQWFLERRSLIPRKFDEETNQKLDRGLRVFSMSADETDPEKVKVPEEHKQVFFNLIWELRHPEASRPGTLNRNGRPIQHPWAHGDEYIHGAINFMNASEDWCHLRFKHTMAMARKTRLEIHQATDGATQPNIFKILGRDAAPYDDGINFNSPLRQRWYPAIKRKLSLNAGDEADRESRRIKRDKDVKYEDVKCEDVKYEDVKHEDVKHEDVKHEDVKHEDVKHEDVKHEDIKKAEIEEKIDGSMSMDVEMEDVF